MKQEPSQSSNEQYPSEAGSAGPGPKTIAVLVKETGRDGHSITCSIEPANAPSAAYVKNGDIILPQAEGPFRIRFRLEGLDWDADQPFATARGGCPGKKGNDNEQIFVQPPDRQEMAIINLNAGSPCTIHYRMNFTNGDYCDPIMINRGS